MEEFEIYSIATTDIDIELYFNNIKISDCLMIKYNKQQTGQVLLIDSLLEGYYQNLSIKIKSCSKSFTISNIIFDKNEEKNKCISFTFSSISNWI